MFHLLSASEPSGVKVIPPLSAFPIVLHSLEWAANKEIKLKKRKKKRGKKPPTNNASTSSRGLSFQKGKKRNQSNLTKLIC